MSDPVAAEQPAACVKQDPFNYPMPQRKDLMSLSTIRAGDGMKTTTSKFTTVRGASSNMATKDIDGKYQSHFSNF